MLKRKNLVLAGAVAAVLPLSAKAATITINYDLADFVFSTSAAGTYTSALSGCSVTGSADAPIVTMPAGDFLKIGLQASVANNGGLGLAAFQTGLADSSTSVVTGVPGPIVVNPFFSSLSGKGSSDGAGGINATLGTAGSYVAGGTSSTAKTAYGVGTPGELYSGFRIQAVANGQATYTVTNNVTALQVIAQGPPTTGGSPTYINRTYTPGTDTLSPLPSLTINVGTGGGGGSTTGSNKIIALAPTTLNGTAPNGYGNGIGTLTSVGGGKSNTINPSGAANVSGYVNLVGTANGYVLLQLALNGTTLTPGSSQLATIVSDINASNPVGAVVIPTTGSPLSQYASAAGGSFDVAVPLGSQATFAYDFSNTAADFTDSDTALGSVSVTAIAAVPEPATAAGVILGAAGLLLGRRKSRLVA